MKKIILAGALSLALLTSCNKTQTTDDLSAYRDPNMTVNYVVVSEDERDDMYYILTGQKLERSDESNFEIGDELDEEDTDLNTDLNSPKKNERPEDEDETPIETNEITIEAPEPVPPSDDSYYDNPEDDYYYDDGTSDDGDYNDDGYTDDGESEPDLPDGEDGAASLEE